MSPLLLCRNLTAEYGRIRVVHGVDIEGAPAEVLAILGANGAGKSSLLGAIVGTVRSGGSIELDGRTIHTAPPHGRAAMGLAFCTGGAAKHIPHPVDAGKP